ncbi:TRAP transporter large permease [Marinobacter sp. NFXS11]|uniref:TRAP transporter large permease n=1 Tax=Marinobacter sp. NFXS11 TaxID=2818432 RepID=UPI0032DFE6EC
MVIVLPFFILFFLLMIGIPVALSLAISGAIGIILSNGFDVLLGILSASPGSALTTYELLTVPMFILMAEFMGVSGITNSLFSAVSKWTQKINGGVGIAAVITGAAFGAISGSSTAAAATLGKISTPAMLAEGYSPKMAGSIAAISGTIAMLIPPSVALIFYGLLSGVSIGDLLIAGIVPGILVTLTIAITIKLLLLKTPIKSSGDDYTLIEKIAALKVAGPFILLFGIVTGLIYTGIATPVESSALGALGAFILALKSGRLGASELRQALVNTCCISAMIGLIIVCAHIFGYFITMTGVTRNLVGYVGALDVSPYFILFFLVILYLVLGLFLDLISILILTIPVVLPVVTALGFDPIWFGVIVILLSEIGIVTPPVGMNVFVVAKVADIPVRDLFAGVIPYIAMLLGLIALLIAFPEIVLWLPSTAMN